MSLSIRRADYFRAQVEDRPGAAYQLLSNLAGAGINMLAFNAIPLDATHTQLVLFPEDDDDLAGAAEKASVCLDGPHRAVLIQGDDHLGALCDVHAQLFDAGGYAQYFAPSVSYASADFAVYTAALQKAVDVLRQRGGTTKGAMFYELGGGIGKAGAPPL